MIAMLALTAVMSEPPRSARVTVDGPAIRIVTDAGAGGYQAFPDICRTKDGSLLCVFYAGYQHISHPRPGNPTGSRICSVRSTDEGKTWSSPSVVVDTPIDDRDPSVCCLPNGILLCTFFTYGTHAERTTYLVRSTDGGKTWSDPDVVLPGYATSTPARRLRSGRLLLPVYNDEGDGRRAYAGVCISDDNGHTWSTPRPIGMDAGKRVDETDVYERKDGTILAISRDGMYTCESRDHGWTWSQIEPTGFPGHCPCLLMTRAGVLLLGHRLPGTSIHWSLDEGRTWAGTVQIDEHIGAYPSMVELRDGHVLCVFYEEGTGSGIRAVRLRISISAQPGK